jgi:hypothetical protein
MVAIYGKAGPDVRIRRVKTLQGEAKANADALGLKQEDLVLVRATLGSLQTYEVEKVEGDPVSFLLKRAGK